MKKTFLTNSKTERTKGMTSFKISHEEMILLQKLIQAVEQVDKVSKKIKKLNSNSHELNLTADMFSQQTKKFVELLMMSIEADRGVRSKIN
jgi:hypothetical protein